MRVKITYEDGNYSLSQARQGDIYSIAVVSDDFWARYEQHARDCQFWHTIIGLLDNEVDREEERREAQDQ